MPDCLTCQHSNTLHNADKTCSVPGCACDELRLPEVAPDVKPPKPGACIHIYAEGAVWVLDDMDEVDEKLNESSGFVKFMACDVEDVEGEHKKRYCTFPLRVRPQAIMSFHEFPQERWDNLVAHIR